MGSRNVLVLWFQELLDLFRRRVSGSLEKILNFIYWVNQCLRSCRSDNRSSDDGKRALWDDDGHSATKRRTIAPSREADQIILSCSAMPILPPPVYAQGQTRTLDSMTVNSINVHKEEGFLSEAVYHGEHESPVDSPLSTLTHGTMCEEPQSIIAAHVLLVPTLPSYRPRYERQVVIRNGCGPWDFRPLETLTVREKPNISPWTYYVQPEGQPYYAYASNARRFSYLTEADVGHNLTRENLEHFIDVVEWKAKTFEMASQIPANVEVVLDIEDGNNGLYYMVDLDQKCLFWLDDFDLSPRYTGNFGFESKDQFEHILAFEFWQHVEHFPISHRPQVPMKEVLDELLKTLNYFNIDSMTSIDSTVPYDRAEILSFISTVKDLQSSSDVETSSTAIVSAARLMGIISNERTFNFYGFHGARLSTMQSVRGMNPGSSSRTIFMKLLSPLLFFAPDNYIWRIERLWVDGVLRERSWKPFHAKVYSDINGVILLSSILLLADVGLLAVPNVLSDNGAILWSSPAAATSQVSAIATLASIVTGLLIRAREVRVDAEGISRSLSHTTHYLGRGKREKLSIECLAIQFSLPYALLLWGVVTFSASIAIICFNDVRGTPNLISRIIFAAFWLFVLILVLWTVVTGWEFTTFSYWTDLFKLDGWLDLKERMGCAFFWRQVVEVQDQREMSASGMSIEEKA